MTLKLASLDMASGAGTLSPEAFGKGYQRAPGNVDPEMLLWAGGLVVGRAWVLTGIALKKNCKNSKDYFLLSNSPVPGILHTSFLIFTATWQGGSYS